MEQRFKRPQRRVNNLMSTGQIRFMGRRHLLKVPHTGHEPLAAREGAHPPGHSSARTPNSELRAPNQRVRGSWKWFACLAGSLLLLQEPTKAAPVKEPVLRQTFRWLETSWFGAPAIYDLDGDGNKELIGTYYSVYVWDSSGNLLDRMDYRDYHLGRVYAPPVVADLEGDGITEIVVGGSEGRVAAYEWFNGSLRIKSGWPHITYDQTGMSPEVRSLAAADLDHDGDFEVIAANTQTDSGEPQLYVLNPDGTLYQPPGILWNAWPRYNSATGPGNDADANGPGNHGYGCFGLNIGVGHLDDDPELEIVVTFDNHQINVFDHDGISHLASDYYRNRSGEYSGNRLNWGQMIRWFDDSVEESHYHLHQGDWPHPSTQAWCQWTASPCNVVDLNLDGWNEVVGIPNVEMNEPYETIAYGVMVLSGSQGTGSESARRLAGWEALPTSDPPQRPSHPWYPPTGIPAPTTVSIVGGAEPEIIVPMNDGYIYAFAHDGVRLWRYDYTHGTSLMYATEVLAADLNEDSQPELIFCTYGDPESTDPGVAHGYLCILDREGNTLHDLELPIQGSNGNGKGAPAAPTLGDLDGDGTLEIIVQTFAGNCFMYSVPGSAENALLWPTARGTTLRQGRAAPLPSDVDSDGIPDWWELKHSTALAGVQAGADQDGDGTKGWEEYVADTDPLQAASFLTVLDVSVDGGFRAFFQSSTSRTYSLQHSHDLQSWVDVEGQTMIPGTGGIDSLTDPAPLGNLRLYRIQAMLPE